MRALSSFVLIAAAAISQEAALAESRAAASRPAPKLTARPADWTPPPPSGSLKSDEPQTTAFRADDPVYPGLGPCRVYTFDVAVPGPETAFFLHARSADPSVDLLLRVEDAATGEFRGEDDDGGGRPTPQIQGASVRAASYRVFLIAKSAAAAGAIELRLATTAESQESSAEAAELVAAAAEVRALRARDPEAARRRAVEATARAVASKRMSRRMERALSGLAFESYESNALHAARDAWREVCRYREAVLAPDHPLSARIRRSLAAALARLGDLKAALAFASKSEESAARTSAADDLELADARQCVAAILLDLRDFDGAHPIAESVLAARSAKLSADHRDVVAARLNLATAKRGRGDLPGARAMYAEIVATFERTSSDDDPDLQTARQSLAVTLRESGDLKEARALLEKVVATLVRTSPNDHPDLALARQSLAATLSESGDLRGACVLLRSVSEARARFLPEGHPDLTDAQMNFAMATRMLGDAQGARAILEQVAMSCSRRLADDDSQLANVRQNLALTRKDLGDLAGARLLEEKVEALFSRKLPAGHPRLLAARQNLASTLIRLGEHERAGELIEATLETCARTLPPDHPDLAALRLTLASSRKLSGELPEAKALEELSLASYARTLPDDHHAVAVARRNHAITLFGLGDSEGAARLVSELLRGARAAVHAAEIELGPDARQGPPAVEFALNFGLRFLPDASPGTAAVIREGIFVLSAGDRGVRRSRADEGRLAPEASAEVARLRSVATAAAAEIARRSREREGADAVRAAVLRRESAARRIRELFDAAPGAPSLSDPTPARVAAALKKDEAAATILRHTRHEIYAASRPTRAGSDRYSALILTPDGALKVVDLGDAATLDDAIGAWRRAVGAPVVRGVDGDASPVAEARENARKLIAARALDPILAAAPAARRVFVAADGGFHLLPFDAIPAARPVEFVNVPGVAALLSFERAPRVGEGRLVALGGVDYDVAGRDVAHAGAADSRLSPSGGAPALAAAGRRRGAAAAMDEHWRRSFGLLPETLDESKVVAAYFSKSHPDAPAPVVLSDEHASRDALLRLAPTARYLHLATHGFFAPDSVPSWRDERPVDAHLGFGVVDSARQVVVGWSPLTLCGLALAGANLPADEWGDVSGVVTAEELAATDLRDCDLCVLSACETNVGILRAGAAIQSLQSALRRAGARTTITSLWKVPDAATKELMVEFYRRHWRLKEPKLKALEGAKRMIREAVNPATGKPRFDVKDWAAWVLSGDPD